MKQKERHRRNGCVWWVVGQNFNSKKNECRPSMKSMRYQKNHENKLTVRIAYKLFTQRPGHELEDFEHWTKTTKYQEGNDYYHHNGAGEMLVFSAADFEDFLEPRPDLSSSMESELEPIVK